MPRNQVRLISTLIVAFVMLSGAWSLHSVVSTDRGTDTTVVVGEPSQTCRNYPNLQLASCRRR